MNGEALRAQREQADLTQGQLAIVLGITVAAVARIERMAEVDAVTAARVDRGLMLLRGLRRQVSRRVARAAQQAAAV